MFFLGIMRRKKKKLKIRFKGEKGIKIEKVYKGIGGRGEVIGCSWNGWVIIVRGKMGWLIKLMNKYRFYGYILLYYI